MKQRTLKSPRNLAVLSHGGASTNPKVEPVPKFYGWRKKPQAQAHRFQRRLVTGVTVSISLSSGWEEPLFSGVNRS